MDGAEASRAIARGSGLVVRKRDASDLGIFLNWSESGSWRDWDAPWETTAANYRRDYPAKFAASLEREKTELPLRALICTDEGEAIGQLSRYDERKPLASTMVGIDICVDAAMGKGYGTRALALWVDWLFADIGFHRVGLETWSYNERMLRVARKLGFREEGRVRELQFWDGSWHDRFLFGMLADDWKNGVWHGKIKS